MNGTETSDASQPLFFDENRSAEIVNLRMSADADPRLREIMAILVRHLHTAVREAQLTQEEWMSGIEFLTAVGHSCTSWRQEFILLSDVLGVSMLVDAINNQRPADSTENTVLGPFYVPDAPRLPNGADIRLDGKGEPLVVRGRVMGPDGNAVAGATLDVWSANEDGFYDVQQQDIQPSFNLRGVFTTDAEGRYWFRTAKPRHYPIPSDGPVGKMLMALGRHPNRAAHLHFIVDAPGYDRVVTHIFEPNCRYLNEDAVFGVKQSLVAEFLLIDDTEQAAALEVSNPFWSVEWNVRLVPSNSAQIAKHVDRPHE
jgi:catechol 1,2-dioxygenase